MKRHHLDKGSVHAVIIVILVVALLGALGAVFYNNFLTKKDDTSAPSDSSKATSPAAKQDTITEVSGTDMMRYTNYTLGFQFDFPKQTQGSIGCKTETEWADDDGNMVKAPVTLYTSTQGLADMTVLAGDNTFTIAQKRAPLLTTATYGSDERSYDSSCKMVDVDQKLIDKSMSDGYNGYLDTERRSWQVYKLSSEGEIAQKAVEFDGFLGQYIASTRYSLGSLENGRQRVTYTFTYKTNELAGGGATKTWYYPDKKLLVHIALGHSVSFLQPNSTDSYYIDRIVDSFKVLD